MEFNTTLEVVDPELNDLIQAEYDRQRQSLELIASENFTQTHIFECLGSVLTNKYSEGLPGKRYYGGNEVIDKIETLCIKRAKDAFGLDDDWDVNVQPYSGSTANMAVYIALLQPGDTIMGLDLPSGGHLTHGYQTPTKKISASSIFFNTVPYKVDEHGYIDYGSVYHLAMEHKPKLIICGASAYPRDINYETFKAIARECGAYLMCDMAHTSGLIASGVLSNPFHYCDIVTTTTHKTLRGPRAGLIFCKKELASKINFAVFPSLQGGPHNNQIAATATQLLQVTRDDFHQYGRQVVINARTLAKSLLDLGYKLATGGTDNHLILIDLKPLCITGSKVEALCERVNISLNKNSVPGDISALSPGGIRIGTAALTSRSLSPQDFKTVAILLHHAIQLAIEIQKNTKTLKLDDFINQFQYYSDSIDELREKVVSFVSPFPFY
jgi:glycine hydroxymethyltransferase